MTYKGIEITLTENNRFAATVGGKDRTYGSYFECQNSIDWAEKSNPAKAWAIAWPWLAVSAMIVIILGSAHWVDARHASSLPRGVLVNGAACSIAARKAEVSENKARHVTDMGIGESACVGAALADAERRAYLIDDSDISPVPQPEDSRQCLFTVTRKADGYYIKCGGESLSTSTNVLATMPWAIPVKGFIP